MREMKDINELPAEILTRVFKYLPLHDRKRVRLTCPFWYHCCNDFSILEKEKFICRIGDERTEEINEFLLTCKYLRPNLEFQGVDMEVFSEIIWKHCGGKIHSLYMHESRISNRSIKHIISYCFGLKHFYLQSRCFTTTTSQVFCSSNVLDELIQNNVVRKNLSSFKLFFDNKINYGRPDIIQKVFQIYPNIKDFGYGYLSFENCLTLLNHSSMINSLTVAFPSNGLWMRPFLTSTMVRLRLVEAEIELAEASTLGTIFNFFSHQKDLKIIRLTLNGFTETSIKMLLFHILQNCGGLMELQLTTQPSMALNLEYQEFIELWDMILNIERLKLNFQISSSPVVPSETPISLELPINYKLKILEWESGVVHKMIGRMVIEHCSNLQHLVLKKVSDRVLQKLFDVQTNIRTLILFDVSNCSAFGFTGHKMKTIFSRNVDGYSISNLKRLEHLEIWGLPLLYVKAVFSELKFPFLKFLRIGLSSMKNRMAVGNIPQNVCRFLKRNELSAALKSLNVPYLETLVINAKPLIAKDVIELCNSSTKLRFLFYVQQTSDDNTYKELFRASPSLCFIGTYEDEVALIECYHKRMSGEVRRLCSELLQFRGSLFYQNIFK